MGVMPIRSATTRHRDSGQHLLYLRISTPSDPPNAKPYSLLQVAKDRDAERKRVKLLRQDPEYKIKKKEKMEIVNVPEQRASRRPPPPEFWEAWRQKNRIRYARGIDKTIGCTSTSVKEGGPINYDMEFLQHVALATASGVKIGSSLNGNVSIKTSGQASNMLKQKRKLLRSISEVQEQQKQVQRNERERFFVINDDKVARVFVTEKTDFPIIEKQFAAVAINAKKVDDNDDSEDEAKPVVSKRWRFLKK